MITRQDPYSTAYDKYGNPDKLVEFRMMVLNKCSMTCKGCFYKKTGHTYSNFDDSFSFALELKENGYALETCYLLPTDIFDNPKDNYKLFDSRSFRDMLSEFNYIGIASTLTDGFDIKFFDMLFKKIPNIKVELQVNLLLSELENPEYHLQIETEITKLKELYSDDIVINLAMNTGFKLSESDQFILTTMIKRWSEDGIIELNFTFLYNENISHSKKSKMLKESISTINTFGNIYKKDASFKVQFNDRTLLSKPAFSFVEDSIYPNPIIPFDEYVFIKDDEYKLNKANYSSFIHTYISINSNNISKLNNCTSCSNLKYCMSKSYFSIENYYNVGCILEEAI